jgi:kinesin light chain
VYRLQKRYTEAIPLSEQAVKLLSVDTDFPAYCQIKNNLALIFKEQGRYKESDAILLRLLGETTNFFQVSHPLEATILNNLADSYRRQTRFAEAEPLFRKALQIRKEKLGSEHPDVATVLNNLGLLCDSLGRFVEAEQFCREALSKYEKALGSDHPKTRAARQNLDSVLLSQKLKTIIDNRQPTNRALRVLTIKD